MSNKGLTFGQCRAARAIIGWSQDQLAAASRVSKSSIATFEAGRTSPQGRTLTDLREALEAAGVIFLEDGETVPGGPGVRLKGDEAAGAGGEGERPDATARVAPAPERSADPPAPRASSLSNEEFAARLKALGPIRP